ncbi:uncharacterized protein [Dermacentor albipictus]|uniref:uncharacterized protein isoform X4 n=1 Tax=Dermacentor albipictus TaxID=60249 RepID=UPI0031FD65CF
MPNLKRSSEHKGYQHDFRNIGYLMPLYLLPLLFYGTHGSRSLYCVILVMSWWIFGPLPKVANAFLLLCCPALLQVADPERLAASFFSAEVLEATLLLLLSTADREVRSRLAPWLGLRSQAEGMRLRFLFPAVCLGTFALATCVSAALITVVLFAIVDHALRSLEEAHLDTRVSGESVPLIADDTEHLGMLLHHAAPSPHSTAGPPTPHLMVDHPLNKYSPSRLLERPTSAKAARPATSSGYSGEKMPLGTMPGPQASRDNARVPLTATDLASREPSYVPCEEPVKDGTLAPQVSSQISGASSVLAEPRRHEPPLSTEASNRSSTTVAATDASGRASGRVISLQPVRSRSGHSGHDDAVCHKTSTSFGHHYGMDDQSIGAEHRHRKYGEIRTAFLVGPVMMAVVGNVIGFRTMPSRLEMALEETRHSHIEHAPELTLWLWALLTFPGVMGVVLFCCGYFYVANLQRHENGWRTPDDHANEHASHGHRATFRRPKKGKYLFLIYLATYGVILAYVVALNTHATYVWTLATLVVIASSVSQRFGDRHAFERHHLIESMPWGVICVLGGAQLITHVTVEGRLVEHLFELASESSTRQLYYLVPVSVALSSNMLSPVSLPLALLHGARNISLQQLAFVGLAGKSILLAMVLVSVNTTGNYFFRWHDPTAVSHPINLSTAVLNPGPC